ncbi:MAG: type II toxin-antitoxin system Phd/YefM family antitoxin [Acidobacteriota bacterium]
MKVSATQLRQNIYALLDQTLATGEPIEVERKGRLLRIVSADPPSKLARLKKHHDVVGDLEDLVHLDWYHEWSELKKK